jgi:hypothetical protein
MAPSDANMSMHKAVSAKGATLYAKNAVFAKGGPDKSLRDIGKRGHMGKADRQGVPSAAVCEAPSVRCTTATQPRGAP